MLPPFPESLPPVPAVIVISPPLPMTLPEFAPLMVTEPAFPDVEPLAPLVMDRSAPADVADAGAHS